MRDSWESVEKQMRDSWETTERQLRDHWETVERPLRDSWETIEKQLRDCWETTERQLRDSWKTVERTLRNSWERQFTVEMQLRHEMQLRCSWDAVEMQLSYSWATVELQLSYSWATVELQLRHSWDTVEIQLKYSWNTVGQFAGSMDVHACCPRYLSSERREIDTKIQISTFGDVYTTSKCMAWILSIKSWPSVDAVVSSVQVTLHDFFIVCQSHLTMGDNAQKYLALLWLETWSDGERSDVPHLTWFVYLLGQMERIILYLIWPWTLISICCVRWREKLCTSSDRQMENIFALSSDGQMASKIVPTLLNFGLFRNCATWIPQFWCEV